MAPDTRNKTVAGRVPAADIFEISDGTRKIFPLMG
jgi:hypothetical protein